MVLFLDLLVSVVFTSYLFVVLIFVTRYNISTTALKQAPRTSLLVRMIFAPNKQGC